MNTRALRLAALAALALSVPVRMAHADVAPEPPQGQQFIRHQLRIEGLEAHEGYVLLAYDAREQIRAYESFQAGRPNERELVNSRSWRSAAKYGEPHLYMLPADRFTSWSAEVMADVARQREECERGIGCAHISRFSPRYAPPAEAVDCGQSFEIQSTDREGGATHVVEVYRVAELGPAVCSLEAVGREVWRADQRLSVAPAGAPAGAGSSRGLMLGGVGVIGLAAAALGAVMRGRRAAS